MSMSDSDSTHPEIYNDDDDEDDREILENVLMWLRKFYGLRRVSVKVVRWRGWGDGFVDGDYGLGDDDDGGGE